MVVFGSKSIFLLNWYPKTNMKLRYKLHHCLAILYLAVSAFYRNVHLIFSGSNYRKCCHTAQVRIIQCIPSYNQLLQTKALRQVLPFIYYLSKTSHMFTLIEKEYRLKFSEITAFFNH